MTKSRFNWKLIGFSALIALGIEVLCISLLVSGGVLFGLAYALLFPSLYIFGMIFGGGGHFNSPVVVFGIQFLIQFFQFFIPVFLVLYACKYGRRAA